MSLPGALDGKTLACNARGPGSILGQEDPPWRSEWLPIPVFLPRKSHGQGNLAGFSQSGCKESGMTEQLTHYFMKKTYKNLFIKTHIQYNASYQTRMENDSILENCLPKTRDHSV